jgi:hypothetical protein
VYTLAQRPIPLGRRLSFRGGFLLPSGKVPWLAISAALLVAILLVLDLETLLSAAKSLFFSNALDLAMVLLAAICSFYVARRSSGYARQLWTLLAVALSLESIAQAISTYYQSFVPGSAEIPWPSDLLFFVWPTPIFMMFLPSSDDNSPAIDWLRLLDFLQVTTVAATAYLYFFYVPSRWQTDHASLLRQILILYLVRDFLLSAGFFLRARTSLSPWLRYFSAAMAVFFFVAVLSDGDYLFTLGTYSGAASWGDFIFALPYLFVVIFAATPGNEPLRAPFTSLAPVSAISSSPISFLPAFPSSSFSWDAASPMNNSSSPG